VYSQHALEQMQLRNISVAEVEDILKNPEHVTMEDGLTVYQKRMHTNNKPYLLRIFVNETKQPPVVVTGYKTSKINKYLVP